MSDIELKPCPFCGAAARIAEDAGDGSKYSGPHFVVRCPGVVGEYVSGCAGNFINLWDMTPEDAAKRWNTRTALTPPEGDAGLPTSVPEGFVLVPVETQKDAERYQYIRWIAAGDPVEFGIIEDAAFPAHYGDAAQFDLNIDALIAARPEVGNE